MPVPESRTPLRILLIEDSRASAVLVRVSLEDGLGGPLALEVADSLAAAFGLLADDHFDLLIVDLNLPDSFGLDTFRSVHQVAGQVPIIILTGDAEQDLAIESVRLGAQDYIAKERLDSGVLCRAVHFAIERQHRLRIERELRAAQEVQASLYPRDGLNLPRFEVAGAALPAEMACGDYFDYLPMPDDVVGVAVGDVSGHGMRSALLMVETRAYLRVLSRGIPHPGAILAETNDLLDTGDTGHFITLFFACLQPAAGTLTYASAGHLGYLLRASGPAERLDSTGLPLGVLKHAPFSSAGPVNLLPGDLVLLPTDGIVETTSPSGELYGESRMLDVVDAHRDRPPREIIESLQRAARDFAGNEPQHDDMTVVVIKVTE